ncbi:Endoplasmic reticulum-Golgi intermediate compartment protein 3 [Entomortierella chlamydospora]|nr:Endoplasmic reticulum-Golgi intermediate compartment protein 3 [Entomortierella chlamydospora]
MTESNFSRFKNLDAYAKTLDDFRVKTSTGAAVTLASALIIVILFIGELSNYQSIHIESSLVVDSGLNEKMSINFNITFPRVPCDVLTLDVMDVAGAHQPDVLHSIYKIQLARDGTEIKRERTQELGDSGPDLKTFDENYCGSCYGADKPPGGCCNTCDHVREAYERSNWSFNHAENIEQCVREGYLEKLKEQADQGCRLWGELTINKVAGNIHVAPGRSFQRGATHVHDIQQYLSQGLNFSHHIAHLSFGEKTPMTHNPLDDRIVTMKEDGLYMFQYHLKVVGTRYHFLDRIPISTNQYSVTQFNRDLHYKNALGQIQAPNGLPGVFFNFDISPMLVIQKEERKSFVSFLTGVCAIVGGIFTVAGLLDGAIWRAERTLKRKMEIGKVF